MPGRDPTRRNRNIGTDKSGYRRQSWYDAPYIARDIANCSHETRTVHGRPLEFLVQQTREGCAHPCSADEIVCVLAALPGTDLEGIGLVFLDQPTRKREQLRPAWGRIVFESEIGSYTGPSVILDAVDTTRPFATWSRSLVPADAKELERLREDGHRIEETKRGYIVHPSIEVARRRLLLRTLPHEVGHWVHYKLYRESETPYDSLPHQTREDFAHSYADRHRAAVTAALESR